MLFKAAYFRYKSIACHSFITSKNKREKGKRKTSPGGIRDRNAKPKVVKEKFTKIELYSLAASSPVQLNLAP